MKKNLIALTFVSLGLFSYSQNNTNPYIVNEEGDTTLCLSVRVRTGSAGIVKIIYVDMDGTEKFVKGPGECKKVKYFSRCGSIFEMAPIKASKPDSYKKHHRLAVNGKIKVYDGFALFRYCNIGTNNTVSAFGIPNYMIQFENGDFCEVKKKDIEKTILPYLNKCEKFKKANKEAPTKKGEKFENMIKLYNKLCD